MNKNSRTIVISGVTRGLGRALVESLAKEGHIVIGCGRSSATIDNLRTRFRPPHRFETVDVASWTQVAGWAGNLNDRGITADILVNNAGIMNQPAPLWQIADQEFSDVISVNINGTVNMIRAFIPAMIQAKHGMIVNMSSGWGRSASANVAPYCASKWAIEGLTRSLAQELPPGLATVALNPGIIDTDMLRTTWSASACWIPFPRQMGAKSGSLITRTNGI